jgi:hypothetical protein
MRDIVNYEICRLPGGSSPSARIATIRSAGSIFPFRQTEGSLFTSRFYEKYRGQTPDRMLLTLVGG